MTAHQLHQQTEQLTVRLEWEWMALLTYTGSTSQLYTESAQQTCYTRTTAPTQLNSQLQCHRAGFRHIMKVFQSYLKPISTIPAADFESAQVKVQYQVL